MNKKPKIRFVASYSYYAWEPDAVVFTVQYGNTTLYISRSDGLELKRFDEGIERLLPKWIIDNKVVTTKNCEDLLEDFYDGKKKRD